MSIKTVSVTFNSGFNNKMYEYLTEFEVKVGDTLVVDSPNDGLVCVTACDVKDGAVGKGTKFIVDVVDRQRAVDQVERYKKRKELLGKLEAKRKEVEEVAVFEWLAANDSEAASLLKELKALR